MKIEVEYSETDLVSGKCKVCGDRGQVLSEDAEDEKHIGWCPDCIEQERFEEMTGL